MTGIKLPLSLSIVGHVGLLIVLTLYAAEIVRSPEPAIAGAIAVVFAPSPAPPVPRPAPPAPPPPAVSVPEPPPPPPPVPVPEPPPPVPQPEPVQQIVPPPAPVAEAPAVPLPPRKPAVRPPARHVVRRPAPSRQTAAAEMAPPAAPAAAARADAAPPVPGPDPAVRYVGMVQAWLERHKRYPDAARQRGEEGSAALRFRVDRFGNVLNYAVLASTGHPDLDAGLGEMMRGARLPPFPAGMAGSEVDLSVTIRFNLTR